MYQFLILVYPLAAPSFSFTRLKVLQCFVLGFFWTRLQLSCLWLMICSCFWQTWSYNGWRRWTSRSGRAVCPAPEILSVASHLRPGWRTGCDPLLWQRETLRNIPPDNHDGVLQELDSQAWVTKTISDLCSHSLHAELGTGGLQHPAVPSQIKHCWCCLKFDNEFIKINN